MIRYELDWDALQEDIEKEIPGWLPSIENNQDLGHGTLTPARVCPANDPPIPHRGRRSLTGWSAA